MVDIQSAAAEIRRGIKKERKKPQGKNIMSASAMQGGHNKLEKYGIRGQLLKWIKAWLNGRSQRVCLEGTVSDWVAVISAVPQGSVLGPLLFMVALCNRADHYIFAL